MKKILFVNRKAERCGVNDYGKRINSILQNSNLFKFYFIELETAEDYIESYNKILPDLVLYNYYPTILPFITNEFLSPIRHIPHVVIYHEVGLGFLPNAIIDIDSTKIERPNDNFFVSPRPLFNVEFSDDYKINNIPKIGSFGFGFSDKNFPRIAELVCSQFKEAVIRLNIPFATFGDDEGVSAKNEIDKVKKIIEDSGNKKIILEVNHDFLDHDKILEFLRENDLNIFLYDKHETRSLSSTIDYALSVKKPIAISNSAMFRHIKNTNPSICVDDNTLPDIIKNGIQPLKPFLQIHSNKNLLEKYENSLLKILNLK